MVALDPDTGRLLWEGKASGPNYSTPIAGSFGGVEQVITFDAAVAGRLGPGQRPAALEVAGRQRPRLHRALAGEGRSAPT